MTHSIALTHIELDIDYKAEDLRIKFIFGCGLWMFVCICVREREKENKRGTDSKGK